MTAQNKLVDENTQMRRSMLELQQQIELLRGDLARLRGQEEQMTRDISELPRFMVRCTLGVSAPADQSSWRPRERRRLERMRACIQGKRVFAAACNFLQPQA